jgi:hypothetical protein
VQNNLAELIESRRAFSSVHGIKVYSIQCAEITIAGKAVNKILNLLKYCRLGSALETKQHCARAIVIHTLDEEQQSKPMLCQVGVTTRRAFLLLLCGLAHQRLDDTKLEQGWVLRADDY